MGLVEKYRSWTDAGDDVRRVPSKIRPQVAVGVELPIRALPPDPNNVAIDWASTV
ncbi:MAG: hypothetical protein ACRDWD_04980 [Acidimicrobiia bacterium]